MSYAGFLLLVKSCNFLPFLFELFPNFLTLSLFAPLYSAKRETFTSLGGSNGCANSQIGIAQKSLASAHEQRRKESLIEAIKIIQLMQFATNHICKSLLTCKMQQKSKEL